jgi:hypothetical protein
MDHQPGPVKTNGKVERFNKTLLEEWAYGRLYRSNTERRRAFRRLLRSYNHRRRHTSLDGLTPMAVLVNNVHGKHLEQPRTRQMSWRDPPDHDPEAELSASGS